MPKRIAHFVIDPVFRSSLRSVILLWKPMAFWTLIVYTFFSALMAPLIVGMVNWGIFRGDRLIVGNEELLTWAFSPTGIFYVFSILLITLTGVVIRYAGLFQIITDDLNGDVISVKEIALHILQRIHILIKLCAFTIAAAVLILLPLIGGLYLIHHIWLTEFDINYYLSVTPPEWHRALITGGIWTGLWGLTTLGLITYSLPALPAYLDGKRTIIESLRMAWSMPFVRMLRFLKIILVVVGIWFLIRITSDATLLFLFGFLSDWLHTRVDSLRAIAFLTGGYLFISLTAATIISFIGFSLSSAIITKFYYKDSPLRTSIVIPGFQKIIHKTISVFTWWLTPLRMALLVLILLAGSLTVTLVFLSEPAYTEKVEVISHRANALGAPENSIPALVNSITVGGDMAEVDVMLTADGSVIIFHDADLMRMAGDPRRIDEITSAELSDLRLITRQQIPDEQLRIPTLEEFLEIARDNITLMIELKYYGFQPELAEETIRIIREQNMEDQVVLMSLSLRAVNQVHQLAPDIPVGYVSAVAAGDITRIPADFLAISHQNITPQLIRLTRERNQPVYAWTVNQSADMVTAIEKGVSGLITDEPDLAAEIVAEMSQLTRTERLLLQFGFLIVDGQSALREAVR
jgi:glycerophosphoryl diester phosphodiesterase